MDEVVEALAEDVVVSVVVDQAIPVDGQAVILLQEVVAHVRVGLVQLEHLALRVAAVVGLEVVVVGQVEREVPEPLVHIVEVVEQSMLVTTMGIAIMAILIMISLLHTIILCIGGYLGISGIRVL